MVMTLLVGSVHGMRCKDLNVRYLFTFTCKHSTMGAFDPDRHDNKLGIEDLDKLNQLEATGIIEAEYYVLDLETDFVFDSRLIIDIHCIVFGEIYDWAGKWRTEGTNIGIPISQIPYAVLQYADQVNYYKNNIKSEDDLLRCLAYTHHRYTQIHPFNNGNGRTARLLTDLIAKMNGYRNIQLYTREGGEDREKYKAALKAADNYDMSLLEALIRPQLIPL